jgi:RNA polymerase sigma-70 factor (ECF subfamily)
LLITHEYRKLSDEDLMKLVCQGDRNAFQQVYTRYGKKLLSFMYRMLNRDREKAEDFLQDIFMKIIERPEQFDSTKKFSTWVYTVATNLCRNEIRNNATRARLVEESGEDFSYVYHTEHPHIDHKQLKIELQQIYAELNERERAVFVLRFQHELPVKEIAAILSCPEGTVKSATYYLLKKIAQRIPHFKPE